MCSDTKLTGTTTSVFTPSRPSRVTSETVSGGATPSVPPCSGTRSVRQVGKGAHHGRDGALRLRPVRIPPSINDCGTPWALKRRNIPSRPAPRSALATVSTRAATYFGCSGYERISVNGQEHPAHFIQRRRSEKLDPVVAEQKCGYRGSAIARATPSSFISSAACFARGYQYRIPVYTLKRPAVARNASSRANRWRSVIAAMGDPPPISS